MKISDLELWLVEIGCDADRPPVRRLLVRLATSSGVEGWGEAQVGWRAAEMPARRDSLLPVLIGRNVFDIEELLLLSAIRDSSLRAALEIASWDLVGRAAGEPLCHLLGGAYRQRVPISVRLPGGAAQRAAKAARELAEHGFHSQIISCSGRADTDSEMVFAVRESTGNRATLRLDGAARYDHQTAQDLCAEIEQAGLEFFLDPLESQELYAAASLARQTSVPLAVSRTIGRPADVLAMVRAGAARFVLVDFERVGGLIRAGKCATVAEAAGVEALLDAGDSFGLTVAAMLHLAASSPSLAGCNQCGYPQLQDDLLAEPLEVVDGMIAVPRGPGLGVDVDRDKIERYQVTG